MLAGMSFFVCTVARVGVGVLTLSGVGLRCWSGVFGVSEIE